jgi:drug/metabolite transporter (DMT)-like permease
MLYKGMSKKYDLLKGFIALILTTLLWGSSFPVIKIVVGNIGGYSYTWIRSLVALLALLPYVVYKEIKGGLERKTVVGGLLTGIAYALGLWLQGWGTGLTTASNSAFITGLNVVFVHIYVALTERSYNFSLALELVLATLGLYFLTSPEGRIGPGDLLVLLGSIAWAAQVILVSRYGHRDPILFTFFEMVPALIFVIHDVVYGPPKLSLTSMLGLVYLGLVCSVAAFSLQAYGQRYVKPEIAAIIFLLEPVFASIFARVILGEVMTSLQVLGAFLIVLSIALASRSISVAL